MGTHLASMGPKYMKGEKGNGQTKAVLPDKNYFYIVEILHIYFKIIANFFLRLEFMCFTRFLRIVFHWAEIEKCPAFVFHRFLLLKITFHECQRDHLKVPKTKIKSLFFSTSLYY